MTPLEKAAWFDQFSPHLETVGANESWCARHWAPCPLFGANGIGATMDVIRRFLDAMRAEVDIVTPADLNRRMSEVGQLCCWLGDEAMYDIWGQWPPEGRRP